MKNVGLFEAKTRLSELCRQVEETGEAILIERRGRPVAELSPARSSKPKKRTSITEDLARFETAHPREADEPDFPDVWLDRSVPNPDPLR